MTSIFLILGATLAGAAGFFYGTRAMLAGDDRQAEMNDAEPLVRPVLAFGSLLFVIGLFLAFGPINA